MARILIIDDDEQVRSVLQKMLVRAGYEVASAANGKQGLRIFNENPTDLVITDILMPVMPGSRLISKLRENHPGVKIIAISGGGSMNQPGSYLTLASDLGAQQILTKPIKFENLIAAVEKALAGLYTSG
jgi:DNA-binding NtrC family response regulator